VADDVLVLAAAAANLPGWYPAVLLVAGAVGLVVLWWAR